MRIQIPLIMLGIDGFNYTGSIPLSNILIIYQYLHPKCMWYNINYKDFVCPSSAPILTKIICAKNFWHLTKVGQYKYFARATTMGNILSSFQHIYKQRKEEPPWWNFILQFFVLAAGAFARNFSTSRFLESLLHCSR